MPLLLLRIATFVLGVLVVAYTLVSAIRTFVLPRSAPDRLTRVVFVAMRSLFNLRLRRARTYADRDHVLELYAPLSLLALPPSWLALVLIGYMGMFWAVGVPTWYEAFRDSGSSLLTLGIAAADGVPRALLMFSEAAIGLIMVALLVAYLPTMYAAFSRHETLVTLLEVRAGSPPSALGSVVRRARGKSHLAAGAGVLPFPQPEHSWSTAAGAVLDAAALTRSALDLPPDPKADLCVRAGYLALRRICDFFSILYHPEPHFPAQPISISRQEFDAACAELAHLRIPLKPDLDAAWDAFAGWRVNYDTVLLALCALTTAPEAPWSSDRAPEFRTPPLILALARRPGSGK
jgi:hypothetical protein